jgi:hypothetical protein
MKHVTEITDEMLVDMVKNLEATVKNEMNKSMSAKKDAGKEVVTLQDQETLPDYLKEDVGRLGLENITTEDVAIPRIKLMQGLSPEREKFSFLKGGDFFHSAHECVIPKPFLAVPIFINKRYILWRPRSMQGGILARANDGKHWQPADINFNINLSAKEGGPASVTWTTKKTVIESGLAAWGSSNPNDPNSPPAATLMYNYLLAFPSNPELSPAVLTFQRTQIKAAQQLNLKLLSAERPTFQMIVEFDSFLDHQGGNEFYSVKTNLKGFFGTVKKWQDKDKEPWMCGNKKQYNSYKSLYETVSHEGLDIREEEDFQDEEVSSNREDSPVY